MSIKCPKCNSVLDEKAEFCNGCGAQIKTSSKEQNSGGLIAVWAVVVPIIIIIGAFFVFNNTQKESGQGLKHPKVEGSSSLMPDFDEIISNLPTDYETLVDRGNFYMDRQMYTLAIECYTRASAIDSSDQNVIMDMGTCYFNSNNNEKALEIFHSVIEKNPDHKIGYLNLGVVYYNQNEMEKTKQYWGELIKRFPGDPLADSVKKYIEQLEQHP